MDATVDDFLSEINEIAPTKKSKSKNLCDWDECFDEGSGYPYYWNVSTNEVTWEMPSEYKHFLNQQKPKLKSGDKAPIYKPAKTEPLFPTVPISQIPDSIIYKISDIPANNVKTELKPHTPDKPRKSRYKTPVKRTRKHSSESEDEKITLISSYGGDTESEDEEEQPIKSNKDDSKPSTKSSILSSTKSTKTVDFPSKTACESNLTSKTNGVNKSTTKDTTEDSSKSSDAKTVTGFALLAEYGDSDEDDELKHLFPVSKPIEEPKISHSTLFPVTQPIRVEQFAGPKLPESSKTRIPSKPDKASNKTTTDLVDSALSKPTQRKRRIGIELVNVQKKPMTLTAAVTEDVTMTTDERTAVTERKGFGFGTSDSGANGADSRNSGERTNYAGFQRGGVMFVKSGDASESEKSTAMSGDEGEYSVLKEKLGFLCEGKDEVSPVQVMLIQLDTLYTAKIEGSLTATYLQKWLSETNGEITKLEKDSAPEGWLLEWDRSQRRYHYRNMATGHGQWEYPREEAALPPQPDVATNELRVASEEEEEEEDDDDDDAMDISTTPPPPITVTTEAEIICSSSVVSVVTATVGVDPVAPPAPTIRHPTPPPAPSISGCQESILNPPLPSTPEIIPPPPPPEVSMEYTTNAQPPPPGVEYPSIKTEIVQDVAPASSTLTSALDSFYSDIAAIESSAVVTPDVAAAVIVPVVATDVLAPVENVKKKKRVKVSQGVSMKNKSVNKLVEKWKNVQKNLE